MKRGTPRWVRKARLFGGLSLAAFVVAHLANHAFGIGSVALMDDARPYLTALWWNPLLMVLLYTGLATHLLLALHAIYQRRTLRMSWPEAVQIAAGLAIPLLLLPHIIGTRGANTLIGFDPTYQYVMLVISRSDWAIAKQALLLLVVWVHLCIGLHYWLKTLPRGGAIYDRWQPALVMLAVLLPVLSLGGYAGAMIETLALGDSPAERLQLALRLVDVDAEALAPIGAAISAAEWSVIGVVALVLLARALRVTLDGRGEKVRIDHPAGAVSLRSGQTVLEALRAARVPHASVCGGRARCTTCRVRVGTGRERLSPPGPEEQAALARIDAAENVRLACQLRPSHALHVMPMLPPDSEALARARRGGVAGREQRVVAMFVDMRGSTALGEARLPYDVVFILNEFFAELSAALEETHGHYAQFSGDGLMALFGLERDIETGCGDALACARRMAERLEALNKRLSTVLPSPLAIGIGIHAGDAIVGTMGPPASPNFSAIGDTVNIAARLEQQCKPLGCEVVVSSETLEMAGLPVRDERRIEVRGREQGMAVVCFARASDCPGPAA